MTEHKRDMTETLGGSVRLTGLHGIMHVCVFCYPVVFALVSRRYQRFFLALCSVQFSHFLLLLLLIVSRLHGY